MHETEEHYYISLYVWNSEAGGPDRQQTLYSLNILSNLEGGKKERNNPSWKYSLTRSELPEGTKYVFYKAELNPGLPNLVSILLPPVTHLAWQSLCKEQINILTALTVTIGPGITLKWEKGGEKGELALLHSLHQIRLCSNFVSLGVAPIQEQQTSQQWHQAAETH